MEKLPVEIVIARISNFMWTLNPSIDFAYVTKFGITEDLAAGLDHIAKTSGFADREEMVSELQSLFELTRHARFSAYPQELRILCM